MRVIWVRSQTLTLNISHRFHDKWAAKYICTPVARHQTSTVHHYPGPSPRRSILRVFIHKSPFILLSPIGWSPQCILSIMPTIHDTLNNTIFIFNICNNLSSRHRDTRKHCQLPASRSGAMIDKSMSGLPSSWQSPSSRMSGWCHLCIEIWDLKIFSVKEYISSCLSEAFMTKMWTMLWEKRGERRAI